MIWNRFKVFGLIGLRWNASRRRGPIPYTRAVRASEIANDITNSVLNPPFYLFRLRKVTVKTVIRNGIKTKIKKRPN